MKALKR